MLTYSYNYDIFISTKQKEVLNMFISVKSLTAMLDQELQFYRDGIATKEQHSEQEFNSWIEKITKSINAKYNELQRISCNKKLIERYSEEIESLTK